jgi:hypothetical protein
MGSRPLEITMCIDSFNRDRKCYPDPSDFSVSLPGRFPAATCALGSLELPSAAYNVESDWCSGYFDVGVQAPLRLPERTLLATRPGGAGGERSYVVLPAAALACTATAVADGRVTWTTAEEHALTPQTLDLLPVGVVRDLPRGAASPPGGLEPVVEVQSGTCVVTSATAASPVAAVGSRGCLVLQGGGVRAFASAEQLARAATLRLQQLELPLDMKYDAASMQLVLLEGSDCASPLLAAHAVERVLLRCSPEAQCLSYLGLLHAGAGATTASPALRSTRFPEVAAFSLAPGNYSEQSLRTALELQLESSRAGLLPAGGLLVRMAAGGGVATVRLSLESCQLGTPRQVARRFNAQVRSAWSAAGVLPEEAAPQLSFAGERFELASTFPFAATWIPAEAAQGEQLWQRLGFEPNLSAALRHTGSARRSPGLPADVTLPNTYRGQNILATGRYVFQPQPRVQTWPPPLEPLLITLEREPGGSLWSEQTSLPPEYLVRVTEGAEGTFARAARLGQHPREPDREVLYFEVVSGFAAPAAGRSHAAMPLLVQGAAVNLYFPKPLRANWHRLAEMLGLHQGGNLWPWSTPGPNLALQAPARWNLEPPAYVLVDVNLQHMSANVVQRCGDDMRTSFLAKVPLYSSGRSLERGYPMQRTGSASVVSELRITLLTPWHTLYPLRGREWSCTLMLATGTAAAQTLCP